MKDNTNTHLFGISGEEEALALADLAREVEEAKKFADEFFNTNWEMKNIGMSNVESEALDNAANGAGYRSGCVANHETYF